MGKTRIDFQHFLESFSGTENVYFQPPPSLRMTYPAIVYTISKIENLPANDMVYAQHRAYDVTIIDKNPDSEIAYNFSLLPLCRFNRRFSSDNLNHFVYTIYY